MIGIIKYYILLQHLDSFNDILMVLVRNDKLDAQLIHLVIKLVSISQDLSFLSKLKVIFESHLILKLEKIL